MENLSVLRNIPTDVINIITSYSDFRLGLLSRPLRIAWEVADKNAPSYHYRSQSVSGGDDLLAMVVKSNDLQKYNIQTYMKGKLYSTFQIPAVADIVFHKSTIITIHRIPDDNGTSGPFTYQVLNYNIDGDLLRKFQIKSEKRRDSGFTIDSDDNIVLTRLEYPLTYLSTYCLQQGNLLRFVTYRGLYPPIQNEKGHFFTVNCNKENCKYYDIEKYSTIANNEIIAKIPILKTGHCQVSCCVPGHPEKILISICKVNQPIDVILVDFENLKTHRVFSEREFNGMSVGPTGKITVIGWGFIRCFE